MDVWGGFWPSLRHPIGRERAQSGRRQVKTLLSNRTETAQSRTMSDETSRQEDHYSYSFFTAKSRHLLITRRFFERSQHTQRRLLGFGESPDARDVESLVGPILPQSL